MRRTILIVEDYDDSRRFMKLLLETYGYKVIEAGNGLDALETVRREVPDLILMDISMPVMDGLEATKTLRTYKRGAKIPVIAITAYGKRFYKKAIEAGCNDLIEKPVDFDALETKLKLYLEN
jgi:CheY-like chemotaxis protein